jgi:hypothetical protein
MGKQVHKKKQHKRANPLGGSVIQNGMADIVPKEEEILPIIQKVSPNCHSPNLTQPSLQPVILIFLGRSSPLLVEAIELGQQLVCPTY